ncbi:hypothetical protein HN011_005942 [Eciton burchellii]|nr:hypothetical protein HN011_005942 [Eciton burchellii]
MTPASVVQLLNSFSCSTRGTKSLDLAKLVLRCHCPLLFLFHAFLYSFALSSLVLKTRLATRLRKIAESGKSSPNDSQRLEAPRLSSNSARHFEVEITFTSHVISRVKIFVRDESTTERHRATAISRIRSCVPSPLFWS